MKTNVIAAVMGALLVMTGAGCGNARLQAVGGDEPAAAVPVATPGEQAVPNVQLPTQTQAAGTPVALEREELDLPNYVNNELVATLRLRGQNPGDLKWAGMRVADVKVTTKSGRELALAQPEKKVMNLAWDANAWSLGTFVMPDGVDEVNVAVELDSFGGYEGALGSGAIDSSHVTTVRFTASRANLAQRGHAVILLDLARSLLPAGEETLDLVPQIAVRY